MALYENIKRLCREKHMTVFVLEQKAGLPHNTVTRWGKTSPSVEKVKKAADALQVTVDELLRELD